MMRLIKAGLMFGNLFEVRSPAMVERYNRALEHLIGRRTELTEFHIDIVGASPEIAHEFGDELYLNPNGANQMFILLSTEQKSAPLLNNQFSTSRSILRRYIEGHEGQLFALTAREAVTGELLNSVFKIDEPADLLDINRIEITADTVQSHVAEAESLTRRIERFQSEPDAWWDDVLIAEMIEIAKRTGNIQRNPVKLPAAAYEQENYYTAHLGGVYVFRDAKVSTIISREPLGDVEGLRVDQVLSLDDRDEIANWLRDEGLSQLIVQRPGGDDAPIIRQKMDYVMISTAAAAGHDLSKVSRTNLRQLERRYASQLPEEFTGLMDVWRWASMGGRVPKMGPDHPAFFYVLRSSQHDDRDLVNMLLSDLSRMDFRQLFICHKPLFYEAYKGWSDSKKEFVTRLLAEEYAIDKAGAREALFGREPGMIEPAPAQPDPELKVNFGENGTVKVETRGKRVTRKNPWEPYDNVNRDDWRKYKRELEEQRKAQRKRRKKRDDDDYDRKRSRRRRDDD